MWLAPEAKIRIFQPEAPDLPTFPPSLAAACKPTSLQLPQPTSNHSSAFVTRRHACASPRSVSSVSRSANKGFLVHFGTAALRPLASFRPFPHLFARADCSLPKSFLSCDRRPTRDCCPVTEAKRKPLPLQRFHSSYSWSVTVIQAWCGGRCGEPEPRVTVSLAEAKQRKEKDKTRRRRAQRSRSRGLASLSTRCWTLGHSGIVPKGGGCAPFIYARQNVPPPRVKSFMTCKGCRASS